MSDFSKLFSVIGKNVVVSGGGGLLGRSIVECLSQAGASVLCVDLQHDRCEKSEGTAHETLDLASPETLGFHIEKIFKSHSLIHSWINCAYPRTSDWGTQKGNLNRPSWSKNVELHLNSYCVISRTVAEKMAKTGGGSIVNLGSIYGVVGNTFEIYEGLEMDPPGAYAAIKGGIISYSRYLASLYGKDKVRVNTLCPGGIEDNQNSKFIERYEQRVPLRRMGSPEDVAAAALFLASDASSYITGTSLMVDGGWTAI